MKQSIAGVTPPESGEVTVMTVWPTIAVTGLGRWLGRRYESKAGFGGVFTLGNLMVALSIPVALGLFFFLLGPFFNRRYRLTNRRLMVEVGNLSGKFKAERYVALDDFDAVDIQVLPGQAWFHAGEMIFRKGNVETFRISGVSRPEPFRQTCLKTQQAHKFVQRDRGRQTVGV